MNGFEKNNRHNSSWIDEEGNEYQDHKPVSYGAFLKEALKRVEANKQVYPDLVTPRMAELIKTFIYSTIENGGIDADVRERDVIVALGDLSNAYGWKRDEDIDSDMVREEVLRRTANNQ